MISVIQQLAASFRSTQISSLDDTAAFRAAKADYEILLLCTLITILERFERDQAYSLLDMKFDILRGEDFSSDDPLRGKSTVFSWIQGRGLEALAGHLAWLGSIKSPIRRDIGDLISRIGGAIAKVSSKMEQIRAANAGRLSFMMTLQGQALCVNEQGRIVAKSKVADAPANFSDLFYSKGLAAASACLNDDAMFKKAVNLFKFVCDDIRSNRFQSDQETLDPKNPVYPMAGRHSHGPRMIAIGGAALFVRLTGSTLFRDIGLEFIEHILRFHVNTPDSSRIAGEDYDMWEFVDDDGQPWMENGLLRSDPGHAIEFAGLSLKFLRICRQCGLLDILSAEKINAINLHLCGVLSRNFANGFVESGIGICKAFDLIARRPANSDMPWWPLPETMRAASEAIAARMEPQAQYAEIWRKCSNAFMKYFVRPDRLLMANQAVGCDGRPAAVIPATPDADPGYHTGLSIIDCLEVWG